MGRRQDDSLSRLTIDVPYTDDTRQWITRLKDALPGAYVRVGVECQGHALRCRSRGDLNEFSAGL